MMKRIKYLDLSIFELHDLLVKGEVTSLDLVKEAVEFIKTDEFNLYEADNIKKALKEAEKKTKINPDKVLDGIPYVCKDNISTKGIETTASSNSLNGYVPLFDATVIKKLKKEGAILVSKTSLDELAMGGTGTTSHKGVSKNPLDTSRIIGGSSAGSCGAVTANHVPFALGSDTGDSVRKPASYGGIIGFKPSYGLISRYGLFPFAQSLDHIGYFARSVKEVAYLLDVLKGQDRNDFTSIKPKEKDYYKITKESGHLCYIPQLIDNMKDKDLVREYYDFILMLQSYGFTVDKVDMDDKLLNAIYPTYMILSCAEASSNDACLDGLRYGPCGKVSDFENYKEEMIYNRTKGFSSNIKRRFIIGSYSLLAENQEEIFIRAQKARRLIVDRMDEILSTFDGLIIPASQNIAPLIKDIKYSWDKEPDYIDNHMALGNFGGYPSITLPWIEKDNLPIGINITSKRNTDKHLLNIAAKIESILAGEEEEEE